MDKLIEALRETLAKLGLDEQLITAALDEAVAKATSVEEAPAEGNPTEEPIPEEVPPTTPTDELTETPSEAPSADLPAEEVAPEGEQVPPTEEVPPTEPTLPGPAPAPFDPTELIAQVEEVSNANAELKKANEGLVARVQALEEALKNAGVIDGSSPATEVGDTLPSAAPQNPTDDVLGSVLSEINGHKRF